MKLVGNKDRHKYSDEFDFRPDQNIRFRVTHPLASIFFPHRLIMGKMMWTQKHLHFLIGSSSGQDNNSDEFGFQPDLTINF